MESMMSFVSHFSLYDILDPPICQSATFSLFVGQKQDKSIFSQGKLLKTDIARWWCSVVRTHFLLLSALHTSAYPSHSLRWELGRTLLVSWTYHYQEGE